MMHTGKMTRRMRACAVPAICLALAAVFIGIAIRGSQTAWKTDVEIPAPSDDILMNPDCGIYHIYHFRPDHNGEEDKERGADYDADSEDSDSDVQLILEDIQNSTDTRLVLLEINLENYRDGDITEDAIGQIDKLLSGISVMDKDLIVRFLYDWDGKASLTEPGSLDVILRHMEQVGPALLEHKNCIFTLQGLFIGNWGEMNGSRFQDSESMKILAEKLREVTRSEIRLSVRTPAQWRIIEDVSREDLTEETLGDLAEKSDFGLFNDGLTGSSTDYGTYADDPDGIYESLTDEELAEMVWNWDPEETWPRDPEILFQGIVNRYQPYGGEAINVNLWNDLDQTLRSFRRMHVSYLNADYDSEVWDKWDREVMDDGAGGGEYIRQHLGYRYVLQDVSMQCNRWKNILDVRVSLRNTGFAPAYQMLTVKTLLVDKTGEISRSASAQLDPTRLPGGNEADGTVPLDFRISMDGLPAESFRVAVQMINEDGEVILLGSSGGMEDPDGNTCYPVGEIQAPFAG